MIRVPNFLLRFLIPLLFLLSVFTVGAQTINCDQLLTPRDLKNILIHHTDGMVVAPTFLEKTGNCNRRFAVDRIDNFSDHLLLIVSISNDSEAAKNTIRFMARGHENDWHYGWPEGIGDLCFRYFQPDPLSEYRVEYNVSFAKGNHVVELKYFNVDDGNKNKFIFSMQQMEDIAKHVAGKL